MVCFIPKKQTAAVSIYLLCPSHLPYSRRSDKMHLSSLAKHFRQPIKLYFLITELILFATVFTVHIWNTVQHFMHVLPVVLPKTINLITHSRACFIWTPFCGDSKSIYHDKHYYRARTINFSNISRLNKKYKTLDFNYKTIIYLFCNRHKFLKKN